MRSTATVVDPKRLKAEQERAEAERIRAREKLEEKQAKALRKFSMPRYPRPPQHLNAGEWCCCCWDGFVGGRTT